MDQETKEIKNHLATIQSCLQEIQSIAKSIGNDEGENLAENMETDVYELAESFGLGETDF